MTVIFLGDKPSARMRPGARPFEGATCFDRLTEWCSKICHVEMRYRNAAANSRSECYYSGMYSYLPGDIAHFYELWNQCDHTDLELFLTRGCKFIALGDVAANRLTNAGVSHFKLPHPSGRNRIVNDQKYIKQQLQLCKEWINS